MGDAAAFDDVRKEAPEFKVGKNGKVKFTQKAIILREQTRMSISMELDNRMRLRMYILFAIMVLSAIIGGALMMYSMGIFTPTSQRKPAIDGVVFGFSVCFFLPCLVWFCYSYVCCSYGQFMRRRELWEDRKERRRLDRVRVAVYYDDTEGLEEIKGEKTMMTAEGRGVVAAESNADDPEEGRLGTTGSRKSRSGTSMMEGDAGSSRKSSIKSFMGSYTPKKKSKVISRP
jgi:hypothetical protein